jgi:hypothetical protein
MDEEVIRHGASSPQFAGGIHQHAGTYAPEAEALARNPEQLDQDQHGQLLLRALW